MHAVLCAAARKCISGGEGLVTRDDLYQEGWLALGGAVAYYHAQHGLSLEKWALVCVLRRMKQYLKEFRSRFREVELPEELDPVAAVERSEFSERREGIDAVRALTKGLRPRSVELFRLHFVERRTRAEIAKTLGVHPMALTKRLRRVRIVLQSNRRRLIGAA